MKTVLWCLLLAASGLLRGRGFKSFLFFFAAAGIASGAVNTSYLAAEAQAQLRSCGIAATAALTTFAAFSAF